MLIIYGCLLKRNNYGLVHIFNIFDGDIKNFKDKQGAKTDPEAQIFWLSDAKSQLTGKHPDAGKD